MRSSDSIDTMIVARASIEDIEAMPCRASSCTLELMKDNSGFLLAKIIRSATEEVFDICLTR